MKLKKSHTEPPADCAELIEKLVGLNHDELLDTLTKINTWTVGKCELYHWVSVLDKFDEILGEACSTVEGHQWYYKVDKDSKLRDLVLGILNFTALLIEYSCSRHIYNSIDHVISLMCVADLDVTHSVLNLLYTFTKRSTYLSRLNQDTRKRLIAQLTYLADSWGGKENGYGLAECCTESDNRQKSATTLHFDFRVEDDSKNVQHQIESKIESIYIQDMSVFTDPLGKIMEELLDMYNRLPKNLHMKLYTQLRLAHSFGNSADRLKCVQVRLHAISVLVFMSTSEASMSPVLYPGFVEEIVDLLMLEADEKLIEIKAAALRTITSIVHLDHHPRLVTIIDATGSGEYHGLLPKLIRECIASMTSEDAVKQGAPARFPHSLSTALFSFLYHLSSYESGAEALVNSGMVESLLTVIQKIGDQQDQIMFVTRAVRIVDLVTNVEMTSFSGLKGVQIFIDRLEREVASCRVEAPRELEPRKKSADGTMEIDENLQEFTKKGVQCMPQRSALFKSILNFLKKTIQDQTMAESIRHIMESSLPKSLKHIISNCDYYGASLFLVALEVVQFYVFHEPSLLSNMQETGITDVILQALLIKGPPATKEVLQFLPAIFTAMCMNEAGLNEFQSYNPFEKMFKVLINIDYLQAMKKRRSSESATDTAGTLGSSVDELMRHQNSLRKPAIAAAIDLLHHLVDIGNNPDTVVVKTLSSTSKVDAAAKAEPLTIDQETVSDEERVTMDGEFAEDGNVENPKKRRKIIDSIEEQKKIKEPEKVPLMEYIVNVCKFLDSMLSNNNTPDHCKEFIAAGGVPVLLKLVSLKSLPLDFPTSAAASQVASVLRVVFVLSKDKSVLKATIDVVKEWLDKYDQYWQEQSSKTTIESPSMMLREYTDSTLDPVRSSIEMPIFQLTSKIFGFVNLLQNMTNNVQNEARVICVKVWSSETSLRVLDGFAKLYRNLIWESSCMIEIMEDKMEIEGLGKADLDRICTIDWSEEISPLPSASASSASSNATTPVDSNPLSGASPTSVLQDEVGSLNIGSPSEQNRPLKRRSPDPQDAQRIEQLMKKDKTIKIRKMIRDVPYQAAQDLGLKLSTLFQLLVKFATAPTRSNRRNPNKIPPTTSARMIASELIKHITDTLVWKPPIQVSSTKFRLFFGRSATQLLTALLLDDVKVPHMLMLQHLDCIDGLRKMESALYSSIEEAAGESLESLLEKETLPRGVGEHLSEWLTLIEKLVDTRKYDQKPNDRTSVDMPDTYMPYHVPFKRASFLAHAHTIAFRAIKMLWGKKCLTTFGTKKESSRLLENILTVLRHIIKSEDFIDEALTVERESSEINSSNRNKSIHAYFMNETEADCKKHNGFNPRFSKIIQQLVAGEQLDAIFEEFKWLEPKDFIDRLYRNQDASSENRDLGEAGQRRSASNAMADALSLLGQERQSQSRAATVREATNRLDTLRSNLERIRTDLENSANRDNDHATLLASNVETLVSMGYSDDLARRALAQTRNNLTEAIEFCLTAPADEDDELAMAIRLSLGEPTRDPAMPRLEYVPDSEEEPPVNLVEPSPPRELSSFDKLKKLNSENIARFAALLACGDYMQSLERKDSPYIEPAEVRAFSENMTSGCFQMLEDDPKAVYSVSDLLIATMRRSDMSWTQQAITDIVSKINLTAKDVLEKQNCVQKTVEKSSDPNFSKGLLTSLRDSGFDPGQLRKASQDLSTGLLLLTLLFDEAKMNCAKAIDDSKLMDTIVELLTMAKSLIDGVCQEEVPKWVSSSLLLADLYQKISLADERRKQLDLIYSNQKIVWKYYEEREKKWKTYSEDENNKITKAYEKGDTSCRLIGRRKYFICFSRMIQQSDETPSKKPIMRFYSGTKKDDKAMDASPKTTLEALAQDSVKLTDDQAQHLIDCCVALCTRQNTDSDTIHSSLRIILRVTKKHSLALFFAERGGLEMMFKLNQNQGFSGFYSIASLLIRHLLESPVILKACFRKTVSLFATTSSAQASIGVHDRATSSRSSHREINLMLRQLSPVACRNPELFIEVVQKQLKINIRNYHGGKDISNVSADTPRDVFLNNKDNEKENMKKNPAPELTNILQFLINKLGSFSEEKDKEMEDEPSKPPPLLSQSLLLRILAEVISSYPACASALCKLKIAGVDSNLMEFIIDKLLLNKGETTPDNLCLNLLACFAACDHAKVKNTFIAELKSGLARIVKQPESSQKHHHLRAIVELVLVAIKRNSPPQKDDSLRGIRCIPDKDINSLSITMVKRGVAQDLARTIHTLDLSSPHLSVTLNIIFRALETLSKVTGIAINIKSDSSSKKSKNGGASTSANISDLSPRDESPTGGPSTSHVHEDFPELIAAEREMREQANEALMNIIAAEERIQESRRHRQMLIDAMPPPSNPDRRDDNDQGSNMEYEDEQSQEESVEAENETEPEDLPELQDLYQADANMHDDHDHGEEEDEDEDEGEDVDDDEDEDDDDDDDDQGDGRNYTENDYLLPEGVGMDPPTEDMEEDMNRSDDEEEDDDDDEESIEFPIPGESGHYEGETYEILDPFNHRDMIPGIVPMDLMPRRGLERFMERPTMENFSDTFVNSWGRARDHIPFGGRFRHRAIRTRGASSTSNNQPPPPDNSSRNLLQPLNPTHPLLSRVGTGSNSSATQRNSSSSTRDYLLSYTGRNWESFGNQVYPYYFHRHRLRPQNIYNSPGSFFGRDLSRSANSSLPFSSAQMNINDLLPDHMAISRSSRHSDERLGETEVTFPSAFYRWAEEATVLDGESIHNVVLIVRNDIMPVLEERCKKDLEEAEKARKIREEERQKAEKKKKEEAEKKKQEEMKKKAAEEAEEAEKKAQEESANADKQDEPKTEPEVPTAEQQSSATGPNPNASFAEILNSTSELANLDTSAGDIPQEFTEAIQAASQEAAASQGATSQSAAAPAETDATSQPVDIAPTTAVSAPETRSINPWQEMDPAILNELPEEVRREVYASVLDNVRRETSTAVESTTLDPINDEFLNALPANIRREVQAAHERVNSDLSERAARVGAQATAQSSSGNASGDGNIEEWIRTLPQDLRRTILTDMAEENVAALPEDLQTEARTLQQRTLRGINALESYRRRTIRPSNFTGRANYLGRYESRRGVDSDTRSSEKKTIPHLSPKYMIDAESLSCILAALFVNDNGIQQRKLHMILKNFAMHGSTCNWLIKSLLDIIHRTTNTSSNAQDKSYIVPNWLSLKLEASLGARHSVFQIKNDQLEIHPQAASYICRSVIESLTYLAKWNTKFFNASPCHTQSTVPPFWDLLFKLEKDSSSSNFGKKADPQCQLHTSDNDVQAVKSLEQLNNSVFASLLRMLNHPVINESKSLLDKTLTLISIVAIDLPVINGGQEKIFQNEISNLVSILGRVSSEEGTHECTQILLELSRCHISFRIQVLDELIAGASVFGKKLEGQLRQLLTELKARTKEEREASNKNELTVPAMQKLTSKNSIQASFLRLLKIIEELRRSDFGNRSSGQMRGSLNWRENGQRGSRSRGRDGAYSWLQRGMQSSRFHFDETLNDVIHAAISRNRPDTAETIIDVMERQLSGRGGIQDVGVLLPRFMRSGGGSISLRDAEPRSSSASGSQRASTNEGEESAKNAKLKQAKEESEKLKKEAACLNEYLADLLNLSELWQILSDSLGELDVNKDSHTFMVLQPAVEAFFMVHATSTETETEKKETKQEMLAHIEKIAPLPESPGEEKEDESTSEQNKYKNLPQNTVKFLQFAEKHKAVLNQILRQSSTQLVDGPFSVLTKHIRLLDFDIKRRYFRKELDKIKENTPRGDTAIHVNRETIFDDSFRELHRKKPEDWKGKLYIVFNNEEGQDAGGLLREWFLVISRQMFNPNYALFAQAANDRVTYRINPYSDVNPTDKLYFNFVGHVVAKAILDNKLLECYFTRAFYKHMLGVTVTYKDMEAEDLELYRSLLFLINNPVADLGYEITFSMDFERFGKTETIDLKENGRNVPVTDENKLEYVHLICQEKMVGSVKNQLRAFLEGFYDIIPRRLISIFDEHELELLISGLPTIDIDDLKANTEYQKYNANSLQIQWFWRALKSFNQEERAKFLQFVTGTSKVPLRGFANLEGMNGTQKFQIHRDERSTSRIPCAHTCFNQLDLPVYETYEKLRTQMLKAITESSEGFGLA